MGFKINLCIDKDSKIIESVILEFEKNADQGQALRDCADRIYAQYAKQCKIGYGQPPLRKTICDAYEYSSQIYINFCDFQSLGFVTIEEFESFLNENYKGQYTFPSEQREKLAQYLNSLYEEFTSVGSISPSSFSGSPTTGRNRSDSWFGASSGGVILDKPRSNRSSSLQTPGTIFRSYGGQAVNQERDQSTPINLLRY